MSKRFEVLFYGDVINCVRDETGKEYNLHETITILNEQQATINILLEELVNAQQQGYVVNFLHKNERCSLIPKEMENE